MPELLQVFGHHPEADFDFAIEAEVLEGMAYDITAAMASQWPFWGRLSRALRLGRENEWFGRPDLEPFLFNLERTVTRRPVLTETPRSGGGEG